MTIKEHIGVPNLSDNIYKLAINSQEITIAPPPCTIMIKTVFTVDPSVPLMSKSEHSGCTPLPP